MKQLYFIIVKYQNDPYTYNNFQCHITKSYSAIKSHDQLTHATTWMNLQINKLSERKKNKLSERTKTKITYLILLI